MKLEWKDEIVDNQTLFDASITHLSTMKERAMGKNRCAYLNSKSQRCAIGGIMAMESAEFLGDCPSGIRDLAVGGYTFDQFDANTINVLSRLQTVHDMSDNWGLTGLTGGGRRALRRIAETYNLNLDVFDSLTWV